MDAVLADPGRILERDESRLLNAGVLAQIRQRTSENRELRALDKTDDALVVRLLQLRNRENYVSGLPDRYQHIVVDEVQDLSPPELAVVIDSVEKTRQLTLVGDTAQEVTSEGSFPGWEKMKSHWNFADESSRYIPLTVSHRSTLPIMKLADHILREQRVTNGRAGRVPIWFKCRTESQGIESIIQWLQTALERFPTDLTAVICPAPDVARYATSLLSPTFGSAVRLGDDNEFDFDAGIIVTDVRQAKGLEFLNVLVWNPSYQAYPQNRLGQNKLYVATTRAEENLSFVSWGKPSVLMPPVGSRLVRGIDLTIEDEDDD
jgi:DNA helicase-2/ATP-dependent DNA helicase PcrA